MRRVRVAIRRRVVAVIRPARISHHASKFSAVPPVDHSALRIRDGARAALPLAPAPFLFGLSFGVLADAAGMGLVAATVMSATTFAGSAQFAVATVFEDGGTAVAAVLAAVFLNARYAAISITVAPIVPGNRLERFLRSQLIVDESWALSGRSGRFHWPLLAGAGLLLYVLWVASTAIGALLGGTIDDIGALGLDAAFAVLFLAIAAPYLRSRRALQAAALAAAITLVLLPIAPAGVPIVAAAAACLIGLRA
ncbi:MAG: AzlC family ABC transporter permease [Gaiellaceae bacterium]